VEVQPQGSRALLASLAPGVRERERLGELQHRLLQPRPAAQDACSHDSAGGRAKRRSLLVQACPKAEEQS
jgi:hypothetical protein